MVIISESGYHQVVGKCRQMRVLDVSSIDLEKYFVINFVQTNKVRDVLEV